MTLPAKRIILSNEHMLKMVPTGFAGSLGFIMLVPPPRPIAFFCFSKCFFSFFSARTLPREMINKTNVQLHPPPPHIASTKFTYNTYLLLIFEEGGEDILIVLPGGGFGDHRSRGHRDGRWCLQASALTLPNL